MRKLNEYEPLLSQAMLMIAKDTRFRCRPGLAEILENNARLVIAFSHAAPLSWLPAGALLTAHACARGGGSRKPMAVMDRFFFTVPGLKQIAQHFTQADRPLGFRELIEAFVDGEGTDLAVFPEGSNCFFGDPGEIQPFRSPRFIEIAIRAKAPILVCVHRGSEKWGKAIKIEPEWMQKLDVLPPFARDFLEARLKETGLLTLPMWPAPMDKFEMLCELVPLQVKAEDLSDDEVERKAQIQRESDRIRTKMQELLNELANPSLASGQTPFPT